MRNHHNHINYVPMDSSVANGKISIPIKQLVDMDIAQYSRHDTVCVQSSQQEAKIINNINNDMEYIGVLVSFIFVYCFFRTIGILK